MSVTTHSDTKRRTFTPRGARTVGALFRQRPAARAPYLTFQGRDGFACFLHRNALVQMTRAGQAGAPAEVIGRLAGRYCEDSDGDYVIVEAAMENPFAQAGPAYVEAGLTAQWDFRNAFEQRYPTRDPVGWWHTHPGALGLFYSSTDRSNQAGWTNPAAVGIVLNPALRGDIVKVFQGPSSVELSRVDGYALAEARRYVERRQMSNEANSRQVGLATPARRNDPTIVRRPLKTSEASDTNPRETRIIALLALALAVGSILTQLLR